MIPSEDLSNPFDFIQENINNFSLGGQDYHSETSAKPEGRSVSASRNQIETKPNFAAKQKVINIKGVYPYPRSHIIKHPNAYNGKNISIRCYAKCTKK